MPSFPLGMSQVKNENVDVFFCSNKIVPGVHEVFKTSMHTDKTEEINHKRTAMTLATCVTGTPANCCFFCAVRRCVNLAHGPWAPAKNTFTTTPSNYPPFGKAFKCAKGTSMSS